MPREEDQLGTARSELLSYVVGSRPLGPMCLTHTNRSNRSRTAIRTNDASRVAVGSPSLGRFCWSFRSCSGSRPFLGAVGRAGSTAAMLPDRSPYDAA